MEAMKKIQPDFAMIGARRRDRQGRKALWIKMAREKIERG
jgi:hypothetical protein